MSSKFGAANPRRGKNSKLKIMLGIVALLLVILLLVLVWVLNSNQTVVGTEPAQPLSAPAVQPEGVGVLIPKFRIEAGTKFTEDIFKIEYLPQTEVPPNAVLASQKPLLTEKFAARLINPNIPLSNEDISDVQPINTIDIPVGYRLITILVDNRSGVEGYAKAGARVDVLWTFAQDGKKKIATLARFVKVVSLGGISQQSPNGERVVVAENKNITVSLLVTEIQAKYLELARSSGELSLILVGGTEPPPDVDAPPVVIDAGTMIGDPKPKEEEPKEGVMVIGNDKYVLIGGKWSKEKP